MLGLPVPARRSPLATRFFSVLFSRLLPVAACGAALLRAQQVPEGFAVTLQPQAPSTTLILETPSGTVTFDGTTVSLSPIGQPVRTLLQLPGFAFGSFLLQTGPNDVLFGCTGSQDAIWSLPLQGPAPSQPLALVTLNYDAALLSPTSVLVSARTGGWAAPENDLLVLDLITGNLQAVGQIAGASGPLAVAANGDVYYATGFAGLPVPPGATTVLRFRRSRLDLAILTDRLLGLQQAEIVMSGLDAAGDLAFDDDGDLFFVDWFNSRVGEIDDAEGNSPSLAPPLVDYGAVGLYPNTLQFVPGGAGGVFEPFQPANGTLRVHETDYVAISQVRTLRAAPATLGATGGSPIAAGPFDLVAANGPSLGLGVVAFAFAATPGVHPLVVAGFEQPLLWSNALVSSPALASLAFDAGGSATMTLVNPGLTPAVAATVQIAFVSAAGVLGATAPVALLIGP
ncbi:MAG TPA: hypothetical protein VFZ65_23570 [Planctomycetota bacterium]|nr:hypothetical protein [Planctomycetota bacterium]